MSVPTRRIRGVQDIRTHAGRAQETGLRHQALLKGACLEMEKYRRAGERRSAVHRVQSIDERVREIEREQERLMSKVRLAKECRSASSESGNSRDSRDSSFKIRY